jgi:hypothetical protein
VAVADYSVNGRRVAMRNFEVPKRASELKYWYKAAKKSIPALPAFEPRFLVNADVDVESIILGWIDQGLMMRHLLIIARKRRL